MTTSFALFQQRYPPQRLKLAQKKRIGSRGASKAIEERNSLDLVVKPYSSIESMRSSFSSESKGRSFSTVVIRGRPQSLLEVGNE